MCAVAGVDLDGDVVRPPLLSQRADALRHRGTVAWGTDAGEKLLLGLVDSRGFARSSTKSNQNLKASYNASSTTPPVPSLPSASSSLLPAAGPDGRQTAEASMDQPKRFLSEKYAKCSVKGNFLTLAAQPKNVELGEWLAHQLVEMNRLLAGMLQVVQEVDANTGRALCNDSTCPTMSAGRLTYTWLENGRPAKIPAPSYIVRVQRWIVGKIHDPSIFPTEPPKDVDGSADASTPTASTPLGLSAASLDPHGQVENNWVGKASGFPANFHADVKSIIKQMFRCYAHLYYGHFDHPFWHINRHLELNSSFVHFITVALYYDLLPRKDMEPLQGLIDIFIIQGVIPREAVGLTQA
ncbi:hypothetical protein DV737_g4352, partial [Chaetothyriales sp. CBS 132003]